MYDSYTVCRRADLTVLAAGISGAAASELVLTQGGKFEKRLSCQDYPLEGFRRFDVRRKSLVDGRLDDVASATVRASVDFHADRATAERLLDVQILAAYHHDFRIFTDERYHGIVHAEQDARRVAQVDRAITGCLIHSLTRMEYALKCWVNGGDEFGLVDDGSSVARLLASSNAMISASRQEAQEVAWIELRFGNSGWDVVKDCSPALKKLVDEITEPYQPWSAHRGLRLGNVVVPISHDL